MYGSAANQICFGIVCPTTIAGNPEACKKVEMAIQDAYNNLNAAPGKPADFQLEPDELIWSDAEDELDGPSLKRAKTGTTKTKYKDDHFEVFRACSYQWPPNLLEKDGDCTIIYKGMYARVQECVWFLHHYYPVTKGDPLDCFQYVDANNSLKRNLSWNDNVMKPGATEPWKTNYVPTLTTKSQIIQRTIENGRAVQIRQMSGKELMLLIGFARCDIEAIAGFHHKELTARAGHAFSGFTAAKVMMAAMYGASTAGLTGDPEQEHGLPIPSSGSGSAPNEAGLSADEVERRNTDSSSSD